MKKFKLLFLVITLMAAMLVPVSAAPAPKVTICHHPGPNEVTITVSENALDAHLNHGDYEGACVVKPVITCPTAAGAVFIDVIGAEPTEFTVVIENAPNDLLIFSGDAAFVLGYEDELELFESGVFNSPNTPIGSYDFAVITADPEAGPDDTFVVAVYCQYPI